MKKAQGADAPAPSPALPARDFDLVLDAMAAAARMRLLESIEEAARIQSLLIRVRFLSMQREPRRYRDLANLANKTLSRYPITPFSTNPTQDLS